MKITYKIEKEGYYNVVFSNEGSWYYAKTLKYRWCILTPEEKEKPQEVTYNASNQDAMPAMTSPAPSLFESMEVKEEVKQPE